MGRNYGRYALVAGAIVVAGFFTVPMDKHWVALLSADRSEWILSVARNFSRWGDLWGTGIVAALLFAAGVALRSSRMKRAALAVLLAASLAGLSANVVRFSVGRPRPVSKKPDGLYGPTTQYRLLGFPSAHASTASATASTVAVVFPLIGLPLVALAVGVMWSRIHRRRHHPTDVLVGAFIGALFGIGLGLSAKRESEGTS